MYVIIPYNKFKEDNLTFKKKKKKDKEFIKIIYKFSNLLINDIYIESPVILCLDRIQSKEFKIKNKYMLRLICPRAYIQKLRDIENATVNYIHDNITNNKGHTSIIDKENENIINITLYKDIYTGIAVYNDNDNCLTCKYPIEELVKNKSIKLTLAFNYIWINNYNFGLSWRAIAIKDI